MPKSFCQQSTSHCYIRWMVILMAGLLVLSYGCPNPTTDVGGGDTGGTNGGTTDGGGSDTGGGDNNGDGTSGGGIEDGTGGGDTNGDGTGSGDTGGTGDDGGDDVGGDEDTTPTSITLQQIVQTGDSVPGQPAAAKFTTFSSPIIDADGRVAFWGRHEGGDGLAGLYVWKDDEIKVVVDDSGNFPVPAQTPGETTTEKFGPYQELPNWALFEDPMAWGGAGRLVFVSRFTGNTIRAVFRWRASDNDLLRVSDAELVAEALGITPAAALIKFSNLGVSDDGVVLFRVSFTSLQPMMVGTAVCTSVVTPSDGIVVTLPVPLGTSGSGSTQGAVPDQGDRTYFKAFSALTTLSPVGWMLFQGEYGAGDGWFGIYLSTDDTTSRVVDNRPSWLDPIPDFPANARIGSEVDSSYAAMAISTNNHIAIQTPITVNDSTRDAVIIWGWDVSQWTELLTASGRQASALVSGISDGGAVLVLVDGLPYIMDDSSEVSLAAALGAELNGASLTWAATGGAINNLGRAIVPYTRSGSDLVRLGFWTNQTLLVLADPTLSLPSADVFEIEADSFPETDRPSRSGIMNDNDEAVFRVTAKGPDGAVDTADDIEAIYIGRAE